MISSSRVAAARQVARGAPKSSPRALGRSRSRPAALAVAGAKPQSLLSRPMFYTTERVLQLRSPGKDTSKTKTLYDASRETENCGVGLIASLKSTPSRHVVEVADEMLVRMAHRGGCGCDPASGDGAGR
jgi:Glutamine amidotransferases class-II